MIVSTRHGAVVLTDHAIERYRQRIEPDASAHAIAAAVMAAELRLTTPGWVAWDCMRSGDGRAAGWLVTPRWAMPLRRHDPERDRNRFDLAAITCFARHRRSKADRRQMRVQAEEDRQVAS